jgi:hypothetical protein
VRKGAGRMGERKYGRWRVGDRWKERMTKQSGWCKVKAHEKSNWLLKKWQQNYKCCSVTCI